MKTQPTLETQIAELKDQVETLKSHVKFHKGESKIWLDLMHVGIKQEQVILSAAIRLARFRNKVLKSKGII